MKIMYRSKVLSLTHSRNPVLQEVSATTSPRPIVNLNLKHVKSNFSNIFNKKYKNNINDICRISTIDTLHKSRKEDRTTCNSPYKQNNPIYFANQISTRYNNLIGTSSVLLTMNNGNADLHHKTLGVRYFSSEESVIPPKIQLPGIWKDISESAPVEFVQDNLIAFQSATNLPWWATVVLTTFVVRSTLTLPLSFYQHYILAKVQNLQLDMKDVVNKLKHEANVAVSHYNMPESQARMVYDRAVKNKYNELIQSKNCHPAKGFIVLWTQIPLWITISAALRNLCYMLPANHINAEQIYLELTTGGFGWILNLTDVDHYWIIPISIGIFNLTNIEIMSLLKLGEETKLQKYMLYFFRFISVAMVPIAVYVPSCISLYWASSSAFGVAQNLLILSPKLRRFVGIPQTSTERANPYSNILTNFRAKTYFRFTPKSTSKN